MRAFLRTAGLLFLAAGFVCGFVPHARADAPSPQPTACPASGGKAIGVDLVRGYQAFSDSSGTSGVPCELDMVRGFPDTAPPPVAWTISTDVALTFTADGLQASYTFVQPTVRKDVTFNGIALERDDNFALIVRKRDGAKFSLAAYANANGKCSSLSNVPGNITRHNQCKAGGAATANGWAGQLVITYDALGANRVPFDFLVRGQYTWHPARGKTEKYFSGGTVLSKPDQWVAAALHPHDAVARDRYVSFAPDLGNGDPALLRHRVSTLAEVPLSVHDFASATFSDDTGDLLGKRDKLLSDVLPPTQADALACISCGSFQSDHTAPFDPVVTSKDVLGFDFGSLGVDSVPFSFDATGYPIDSGFKALFADEQIAFAAMSGTTDGNGAARDGVLRLTRQFDWGTNTLRAGVYHAVANRSAPAPTASDTYVAGGPGVARTQTSEASLGFSHAFVRSATGNASFSTDTVATANALVRIGTQYAGSDAKRFEAAGSILLEPPYADFKRAPHSLPHWGFAAGYRNLGLNYQPLDGDFDPLVGLHGFYGKALYSEPNTSVRGFSGASVSVRRFSDAVQARDVAVTGSASARLDSGDHLGVTASFTTGTLSVSQVGRQLDDRLTVRDDQFGRIMLPNTSQSFSLAYKNATYQTSVGVTKGKFQNCDAGLAPPPCFAYDQTSLTGSILWFPFPDVFVAGAVKNLADEGLQLIGNPVDVTAPLQQTTTGHIVHRVAAGAYVFNGRCSTLTYSAEDRGGSGTSFARGAPQPGFTNMASLELQPTKYSPSLLVGYVLQSGTPSKQFLLRLRFGVPPDAFVRDVRSNCDQR